MEVLDPQGRTWTVRRRWLPRYEGRGLRERLRQRRAHSVKRRGGDEGRWYDWFDLPLLDDSLTAIVVSILVIAGLVLLFFFGVPVLLALVDLVVVLAVAVAGIVSRVLFRRPWTVETCSPAGERYELQVVGWRRAGDAVGEAAREVAAGRPLGPRAV